MIRSVRNSGRILINGNVPKRKGYKHFNEFLDALGDKLLKKSADFMKVDPEYPIYAYSEKTFHTILTPSIYELTKGSFIVESPIKRHTKHKDSQAEIYSHGWVDYWIQYKSIRIYLELKHGWLNTKSGNPKRYIQEELWNVMDAQLDKTEKEAEYDQENWAGNKTVFRAGMLILPFYQKFTAKDEEDKKKKQIIEESRFVEIFESVSDKLTPKPKWGAMLLMHRDYQKKLLQQFGNNEFVFRPGFMILMNIKQVNEN